MNRSRRCAASLLVAASPAFGAPMAAPQSASDGRPPHLIAGVHTLFGVARSPYGAEAFPQVSGYALVLLAHAELQLGPVWALAARAPLVLARVEQPAGALYGEGAWGNPQLALGVRLPPLLRDRWQLTNRLEVALGVPLAEHETAESQLEGRALAIADALDGFCSPELYTTGVVPVTLKEQMQLGSDRWRAAASLGLTALVRVSDASLTPSRTQAVGLVSVVGISVGWWPLPWLGLSLSPRLALRWLPPTEQPSSAAQLLLPARIQLRFAGSWLFALTVQAPVAGALGGTTAAGGVGLTRAF